MSHHFNCLITIFISVFVSSCLPDTIPVTYIGLNTTEIDLILGDPGRESFQLIATVSPSDASNKEVHWSSSKGTVASVDHTGLVTALQVDDAPVIITATAEGGLTAECTVRVLKKTISVREVLLNKTSLEIQPGETATLIASVLPSNAANKELIWSSSDEFVATVSAGKVKGVGSGKAIITATSEDGGKEATCEVTVTGSESDAPSADNAIDLAVDGLYANSYIVSSTGDYKFQPVKGNSYESVGDVASVEVLWESFGTSELPSSGDLISAAVYDDYYIVFSTAEDFRKGNAVIAAKDASGTILWSWHIWLTDQPEEQVYYNGAGTMMDRNLGATSATPGDVGALGLLYQWGRKDPFLGSSTISDYVVAKSTGSWPSAVSSSSSSGTVEYAVKNPMTFITATSSSNYDWHYSSRNNKLWQSEKTIYDPCPAGWRVPDGGAYGVWSKALGSSSYYTDNYDSSREGINFSGRFGNASPIWYPASGYRKFNGGSLLDVGDRGDYWSVTPNSYYAYYLSFDSNGYVYPSYYYDHRAYGQSVRCFKEDSSTPPTETPKEYVNLSAEGTANSYIVSQAGDYKFEAVKGNSSESVGDVASVEVLWESFGTDVTPSVGDLIKEVSYSDGYILFSTADDFRKGNAVIAAKDASGTILWSWHIWLTDEPEEQVYYNNAGTMMDRNLGATSATPGEVGALGLLYQWGRKDPFLGSSNISNDAVAKSTGSWPSAVLSPSSRIVEYAVKNPMTFITATSSSDYDWHYSSRHIRLWQSEKTIYDPCPAGWRVPDGGSNGVWSKALGSASSYYDTYDDSREGINFSGNFGSASTIWYPASGYRLSSDGSLSNVGGSGNYWSVTTNGIAAYGLDFYGNDHVYPSLSYSLADGLSVRCLKEGSSTPSALPSVVTQKVSVLSYSSAQVYAKVSDDGGEAVSEFGVLLDTSSDVNPEKARKIKGSGSASSFSGHIDGLSRKTTYYVQAYAVNSAGTAYGKVLKFETLAELPYVTTVPVFDITDVSAVSGGNVTDDGGDEITARGVVWGKTQELTVKNDAKSSDGKGTGRYTSNITGLRYETVYYVRAYATNSAGTAYGATLKFTTGASTANATDLAAAGSANCYIVSSAGTYKFKPVKGNSNTSVGSVSEVEVLWESFGTDETPSVGDLIKEVSYSDGYILFSTPSSFQEGNAVIAAKNSSGTILWSWHIWLTDAPEGQVYYNNAGTMMDRNLGATSAEPGEVGALGLLYQWGRKDPFLGSSSISNDAVAESTGSWPSAVSSSSSSGTVEYAVKNPMTFIKYNSNNYDWYYAGSSSTDNTRWEYEKTIYDPCPAGWRVPDGGEYGVWSKALGSSSSYYDTYDDSREGINFSGRFGNASPIWYPASGYRSSNDGSLGNVGYSGFYWSVTPNSNYAYYLYFNDNGSVFPSLSSSRASGRSVRCLQE